MQNHMTKSGYCACAITFQVTSTKYEISPQFFPVRVALLHADKRKNRRMWRV